MKNSKMGLVALVLLSISFLTAIGQTSSSITVTTDKSSYSDGNTITISGTVTDQLNIPISIVIKDSSQNIVYIAQTNPNSDNTYSTQATAGGDLWKTPGTYEIDVTYGSKDVTSKTTFEFTTSPQPISTSNTGNQTNATAVIPEFGTLALSILAISILAVIAYSRTRHSFRI
ncbi:MAG: PEFG-CTERM sorting domain-containing protein [Thaumarchaeota archaeon]|nr:PEFG-CTERM sorting domain-containing protein [Nitrososphaerota archaeon]